MSIIRKQMAIVEEFGADGDWQERYQRLIRLGRELSPLPEELKTDEAKVRGCSSSVWLHVDRNEDGTVAIRADSDALLVRGLVALLLRVYDGEKPDKVVATEPMFIEELGLDHHLSATRANGLHAMVQAIKAHALACSRAEG